MSSSLALNLFPQQLSHALWIVYCYSKILFYLKEMSQNMTILHVFIEFLL